PPGRPDPADSPPEPRWSVRCGQRGAADRQGQVHRANGWGRSLASEPHPTATRVPAVATFASRVHLVLSVLRRRDSGLGDLYGARESRCASLAPPAARSVDAQLVVLGARGLAGAG